LGICWWFNINYL